MELRGGPSTTLRYALDDKGRRAALREALETLKSNGVDVEDPGDEIGPTGPDSPHMGLWFHDPDGYRWELSVQNGARESG